MTRIVNDLKSKALFLAVCKQYQGERHEEIRRDPNRISITEANSPPRVATLNRQLEDKLVVNASELLYALQGSIVHKIIEMAGEMAEDHHEMALEADIDGMTVVGHIDVFEKHVLKDFKYTSVWKFKDGVPPEYVAQLNGYWWLAMENRDKLLTHGIDPAKLDLVIEALYRDWSKPEQMRRGGDYPATSEDVFEVPKWGMEKTLEHYRERVRLHREARSGRLPLCTDEDRMMKNAHWAVMNIEKGKSIKNCPTEEEANAYKASMAKPSNYDIEFRPGQPHRCLYYCPVRDFCTQWQGEIAKQNTFLELPKKE